MKNYALKWVIQRITASLLIPLTFWFIYSAISLSKMEYDETISFFQSYFKLAFILCNDDSHAIARKIRPSNNNR